MTTAEEYAEELNTNGYTIIQDPAARALVPILRQNILELVKTTEGPMRGLTVSMLLGRHPAFEQAVVLPKLLDLVKIILGKDAIISQVLGVVRPQGHPSVPLHADSSWFPTPLPSWDLMMTACWALDDFTKEGGGTLIVPGSHRYGIKPEKVNSISLKPATCLAGSIVVWNGRIWHANYVRTLPGERVTLHVMYNRHGITPMENYTAKGFYTPHLATLLGRDSFLGTPTLTSGGVNPILFLKAVNNIKEKK